MANSLELSEQSGTAAASDERPWGRFTVLEEGSSYKLKRIEVDACRRLSYQLHHHRSEHWFVVQGTARVTVGAREFTVHAGQSVDVPCRVAHRIGNVGDNQLVFIEVQLGDYLGEDDIVRLEDDFGRAPVGGQTPPSKQSTQYPLPALEPPPTGARKVFGRSRRAYRG